MYMSYIYIYVCMYVCIYKYIYIDILTLYAFQKMSCIHIKLKDIHKIVIFQLFTNLLRTLFLIFFFFFDSLRIFYGLI